MTTLLDFYVGAGLVLMALAIPLILRKVKPNPLYGFRIRQTLEDPAVWYEANAYAKKGLLVDGMITVIAAIAMAEVPGIGIDRYALSVAAIVLLALAIRFVATLRHIGRMSPRIDP